MSVTCSAEERPMSRALAGPATRSLAVLVVDDYPDTADSLAILLRLAGHDVRAAYNGPDALALLNDWQPDVAIWDLALPRMDGFKVAERLCAESKRRPLLVALTGFGMAHEVERTKAA